MTFLIPSLARYLGGEWHIVRRIHNRLAGEIGRLEGLARFGPDADRLRYYESGEMRFGAYRGAAAQSYLFGFDGDAVAEVRYADGRFFHRLDLSSGIADVAHQCAADLYRGRYRVLGADRWALSWQVTGPRKDYLMSTRYERV
ncbi:DUF6314 family protein [Dongia sp.]|uniref:DUF6314 family protein n=1 Tax=Dongia sp. TaxID=1977262 RepID=UPI0035AF85FD